MTRTSITAIALFTVLFTGCAMGAEGTAAGLTEAPYTGEGPGAVGLVYDRFSHVDEASHEVATLEVTAIPNVDAPGFWDDVELVYTVGEEETVVTARMGPDVEAPSPEVQALFETLPQDILEQIRDANRLGYEEIGAEPSTPNLELRYAVYAQYAASVSAGDANIAPFGPGCDPLMTSSYADCFEQVRPQ